MEITAANNTWSNSRKKRRQEMFKQKGIEEKKNHSDDNNKEEKDIPIQEPHTKESIDTPQIEGKVHDENVEEFNSDNTLNENLKRKATDEEIPSGSETNNVKKFKADVLPEVEKEPLIVGSLVIRKYAKGSTVELFWLRGSGGRDAAHQILQYFKNHLNTSQPEANKPRTYQVVLLIPLKTTPTLTVLLSLPLFKIDTHKI